MEKKIATLPELKAALGTAVNVTVFRKLRELGSRTSYSHRGRYYTLEALARFDEQGLWSHRPDRSHRSVHFSRYGTLLATAEAFVTGSEAGYSVPELAGVLNVGVKEALLKLVRQERIARERVSGLYVYCALEGAARRRQLLARRLGEETWQRELGMLSEETASNELKAALVLFAGLLDEKQRRLYAGLESLKWGHGGDRRIAGLMGLDVHTVSRGRRELSSQEFEESRVRKPGGGRKRAEKKRRRSSRESGS